MPRQKKLQAPALPEPQTVQALQEILANNELLPTIKDNALFTFWKMNCFVTIDTKSDENRMRKAFDILSEELSQHKHNDVFQLHFHKGPPEICRDAVTNEEAKLSEKSTHAAKQLYDYPIKQMIAGVNNLKTVLTPIGGFAKATGNIIDEWNANLEGDISNKSSKRRGVRSLYKFGERFDYLTIAQITTSPTPEPKTVQDLQDILANNEIHPTTKDNVLFTFWKTNCIVTIDSKSGDDRMRKAFDVLSEELPQHKHNDEFKLHFYKGPPEICRDVVTNEEVNLSKKSANAARQLYDFPTGNLISGVNSLHTQLKPIGGFTELTEDVYKKWVAQQEGDDDYRERKFRGVQRFFEF